jgi:hypothetical protein
MSSLTSKDRVSLCLFTFSDGRRCCTPRTGSHPHFCFYHAQKEARAQAAETLGKDLACFFSGDYLSACDLSTALSRLIPAVVRGEVKPKTARTVAYLIQTLMQAIHISREEYVNAFGTEGWRKSIRNGVNANYDHRFPPAPEPDAQQPATTSTPLQSAPPPTQHASNARRSRPNSAPPQSAAPKPNPAAHTPQPASSNNGPASQTAHPNSGPASQTVQPNNPPPPAPPRPQPRPAAPTHDPYAVRFDHNYRLRSDGKLI